MLQAKVFQARDTVQIRKEVSWLAINCGSLCCEEPCGDGSISTGEGAQSQVPTATTFSTKRSHSLHARSVPRMIDVTILAVTENPSWLEFFWSKSRSVQGSRLVVTGSMEEACDLLSCTNARLIVVDWQDATVSSEQMDHLLWANSILAHPARVLVVAESYRRDHALSLFQMGVDDYIGVSEHSDQLRTILERLLARTTVHSIRSAQPVSQAPRLVQDPLPLPARWVAAGSSA